VHVERLTTNLHAAYTRFLLGQDASLLYYGLKYRSLLQRHLECDEEYLIAADRGEVHGVLPLLCMDSPWGRVYNSLPFYGSNGGILANRQAARTALLAAYNAIATRPGVLGATIVENPFAAEAELKFAATHYDRRIAQFTPLPEAADPHTELLDRFEGSARRNVRKAESSGLRVKVRASHMDSLQRLHEQNMQAIGGRAKPAAFFDLVRDIFEEHTDYDVYAALDGDRVVAALLLFYFHKTVEYFTPATHVEFRAAQPLALLAFTAMVDCARRGLRCWNWGGTWESQPGVYRFKRKWAAQERPYKYHTQLNAPGILENSPQELLDAFGHFYVVPFRELQRRAA
jgi:CelD/BcsL family acetyltransferase involved in cellulose biosynthesis